MYLILSFKTKQGIRTRWNPNSFKEDCLWNIHNSSTHVPSIIHHPQTPQAWTTPLVTPTYKRDNKRARRSYISQRWSNRTRVLVLVPEYEYFLSTRTRVWRKVIVLVLEYITKVIVLTITSHDYIFVIWTVASKYIRQIKMTLEVSNKYNNNQGIHFLLLLSISVK